MNHASSSMIATMSVGGRLVQTTFRRSPSPTFTISRAGYDFTAGDVKWTALRRVFLAQFPNFRGSLAAVDSFFASEYLQDNDTNDYAADDDGDSTYVPSDEDEDDDIEEPTRYVAHAHAPVAHVAHVAHVASVSRVSVAKAVSKVVKAPVGKTAVKTDRSTGVRRSARIASRA